MIANFQSSIKGISSLVQQWEPKLLTLPENTITNFRNSQNRNIKQIIGHMVDSASNNTHRMVHLQYQNSPFEFPNYANQGNNDRWIAIQNYENEHWENLVYLWKYTNLHVAHVIGNINQNKLNQQWIAGLGRLVSLNDMALDYSKHMELHLNEISDLISNSES